MSQQDLTADMLTRIRNSVRNQASAVMVLKNKLNHGIAQVLQDEGYIQAFATVDDGRQGSIRIDLKYGPRGEDVIHSIDRASRCGRRMYSKVGDLPRPLQGMGIAIVSTSSGVMSDRRCREEGVGGEIVAIVT
jgi:small subunit ribosomal protein S8